MDNEIRMIRAFFAIPIAVGDRRAITSVAQPIIDKLGENVRWTSPANWHLTVRFLGDVSGDVIVAIARAAERIAGTVEKFPIKINKIYGFPSPNSRTIAAHAFVNEQLNLLFKSLDNAANAKGISRELRRFRPHISLGKFQTRVYPYDPVLLKDFTFIAREIVLYQSKPENQKSEYIPLKAFSFK